MFNKLKHKHKHKKPEQQTLVVAASPSAGPAGGPPTEPVGHSVSTQSDDDSGRRSRTRRLWDKVTRRPSPVAPCITSADSNSERQSECTANAQELLSVPSPDVQTIETAASGAPTAGATVDITSHQALTAEPLSSPNAPPLESQPQSLWDRAYDALREGNSSLVEKYEILLTNYEKLTPDDELEDASESTPTTESLIAAAHNLIKSNRRQLLKEVIDRGLERREANRSKYTIAGHELSPRDQLSKAADFILWAKTWVNEAVKSSPEASIAWAGVSIVLPLLTKAKTAEDDNRDGFTDVTFRMRYYTELEHMLQRLGKDSKVPAGLMAEANSQIVNLYQHIIEYQIRSAVRYFKTSLWRYTGDVILPVDWKQMQAKIDQLDKTIDRILNDINHLAVYEELKLLNETSEGALTTARELLVISVQQLRVQEEHRDISAALLQAQREAMQNQLSEKEEKCLQLFRLTSGDKDATYEWYKGRVEDRVQETCNWFLRHPNFQTWLESRSGPLLVSADPGCGKSVLAKFLIDHELRKLPSTTICYFFFKDQDQCTTRQALCALLHQLLSAKPFLVKYAMRPYEKEGSGLAKSTNSLWGILEQAVKDDLTGPVILVLDALDECAEPDFEDLMRKIRNQLSGNQQGCERLRYLFTSRPYEQIVSRFRALLEAFPYVRIPGEDQSDEISLEVNHVINHRVDQLTEDGILPSRFKDHLRQRLRKIEHRTYLWVYLIFDHLRNAGFKKTERGIEAAIDILPRNVSEAYDQILNKSSDNPMVRKALGIILAANKPLTLSEMNVAVNINYNEDLDMESDEDFKSSLRSWCGLFVSVYHKKVYFLHQTAREFLLGSMSSTAVSPISPLRWHGSFTLQDAHRIIAKSCVLYLLSVSGALPENADSDKNNSVGNHVFMKYSASAWDHHFREATFGDSAPMIHFAVAVCSPSMASWLASRKWRGNRATKLTRINRSTLLWGLELASALCLESVARHMLDQGASVSGGGHTHQPPICWASESGGAATVRLLLERGANANGITSDEDTPLLLASWLGHDAVVELLLEYGADTELRDSEDRTSLLAASSNGHEAIARMLLERGADFETKDEDGMTPLLFACSDEHESIVRLLLEKSANIETKDENGRTPLSFACEFGNETIVRLLLEKGANIEAKDEKSRTPLSFACSDGHESIVRLLLEKGANSEAKDEEGRTPLSLACEFGNETIVRLLLEKGANIEAKDEKSRTPLSFACSDEHKSIVRLLLEKGANSEAKDEEGRTPLSFACSDEHESIVRLLLEKGANSEAKDEEGRTPLSLACESENETIVRLLLEKGANIETEAEDGMTPLFIAARKRNQPLVYLLLSKEAKVDTISNSGTPSLLAGSDMRSEIFRMMIDKVADVNAMTSRGTFVPAVFLFLGDVELVRMLLDDGVEVNTSDNEGSTMLHFAAMARYEANVRLLLDRGADANARSKNDVTPLMRAANKGHDTVIKLLLEAGAEFETKAAYGMTPLMFAAREGHDTVVKLLLEAGAEFETKAADGMTPLMFAAKEGHGAVVELLLEAGAEFEIENVDGVTPLMFAAEKRRIHVVELLLEAGADIEPKDADGMSLIKLAAKEGHDTVVRLLLEAGADIESKDDDGVTLLMLAAKEGHDMVVKLLLKEGADIKSKDADGRTPLTHACSSTSKNERCYAMKVMLEHGADVNAVKLVGKDTLQLLAEDRRFRRLMRKYQFDWPSGIVLP